MSGRVIAVLGISGVGKTTMVKSFIEQHPSVLSVRASGLLKQQLSECDPEKLRTASSSKIYLNQEHLAHAFQDLRHSSPNQHFIFDGHSIIDNDDGVILIPTATFEAIAPDLIIFVKENPSIIVSRRSADTSRQRPQRSVQEIDAQQILAWDTAMNYRRDLSIPCKTIQSGDHEQFEGLLIIGLGIDGR